MEFAIRVLGAHGVETLQVEAESDSAARARMAREQRQVLDIRPRRTLMVARADTAFDLLLFSRELLALLEAGLTVSEAIQALHEKEDRPASRNILGTLCQRLAEGQRLAAALAEQPTIFPPLYVGLIRAAEGTAALDTSLSRYIEYRQRLDAVRRHVSQAMIYPVILLGVGLLVSAFLLGYVVPKFASVYQNAGRDIPLASQWLMGWGRWIGSHAHAALGGLALGTLGLIAWLSRPERRQRALGTLYRLLQRLPRLGQTLHIVELARFYLALGTLLAGGLPILAALALCRGVVSRELGERIDLACQGISEGQSASAAFTGAALTTPVAIRLMQVGERTGQLGDMLTRTARFHDAETERFVARFTRSFEPLLMAAIGVLVGTIVVLLYLPIFDLAGSMQ